MDVRMDKKSEPRDANADEIGSYDDTDDSEVSRSDEDMSWISWFCSLKGNEFFVEVDEEYIRDDFNLTGLTSQVPYYDYALDLILDNEPASDEALTTEQQEMIEHAAELLYGLIHARYIMTSRGMALMRDKFCAADFGRCPRVLCYGFPVLPVGQSDIPCINTVKIYCSKCEDIYHPKYSRHSGIDGAYFGTTFPHLFLQTYSDLRGPPPTQRYVPRIFGFKIHRSTTTTPTLTEANGKLPEADPKSQKPAIDNAYNDEASSSSDGGKHEISPHAPNGVTFPQREVDVKR